MLFVVLSLRKTKLNFLLGIEKSNKYRSRSLSWKGKSYHNLQGLQSNQE